MRRSRAAQGIGWPFRFLSLDDLMIGRDSREAKSNDSHKGVWNMPQAAHEVDFAPSEAEVSEEIESEIEKKNE